MSTGPHSATSAHPALRWAGMLVVLAGLFGMHGLDSHGPGGMEAIPGAEMSMDSVVSSADAAASDIGDQAGLLADLTRHAVEVTDAPADAGLLMGMAAMCVAILAAALIALLRLLLGKRRQPVWCSMPRQARAMVRAARDPTGPSLIDLSIQRC